MTIEQERLTPTQEDREAATLLCQTLGVPDITGPRNQDEIAEHFARHRLAALKSPPIGGEGAGAPHEPWETEARTWIECAYGPTAHSFTIHNMVTAFFAGKKAHPATPTTSGDVGKLCERLLAMMSDGGIVLYGRTVGEMCNDLTKAATLLTQMEARESALREANARECQAVWRCAIGDAVTTLDMLKNQWANSKRKAEREAGAVLASILEHLWAARDPAPVDYNAANANGKVLMARVRTLLNPTPTEER